MSLRQVNRYISSIVLLEDLFEGTALRDEGEQGACTKNIFIPIVLALKLTDGKQFNDFINGKGTNLLSKFTRNISEIKKFDSQSSARSGKVEFYYGKIFNPNSQYYASAQLLKKAASSLGFATAIDPETESTDSN